MDTEELQNAKELAQQYGFENLNNDDLELLLDADYHDLNVSHIFTVLYDGAVNDLETAIEIVENNSPVTKKQRIDGYIENTGIGDSYLWLIDKDQVLSELRHETAIELEDGDYILIN